MEYRQARLGRIFVLKFSHREDVKTTLDDFLKKEKIRCASFVFLGAFEKGRLVTGPRKAVVPPDPNYAAFKDGWEVMGVGTVFDGETPQVHMHASMGKQRKTLTGCVRKDVRIFMVIEAVVFELKGIRAKKELDPKTGVNLLKFL